MHMSGKLLQGDRLLQIFCYVGNGVFYGFAVAYFRGQECFPQNLEQAFHNTFQLENIGRILNGMQQVVIRHFQALFQQNVGAGVINVDTEVLHITGFGKITLQFDKNTV